MLAVSLSTRMRASLDDKDRRSGGPPRFEIAMGLNGVVEFVGLVDLDPDASGRDVVEQLAGEFGPLGGVGDIVRKGRPGDVERALDGKLKGVDGRNWSGRSADAHQHAATLQAAERLNRGVPADAVVDDR